MVKSSSQRLFEYFVVCGIGPEIRPLSQHDPKGFHGTEINYMAEVLDQYPPTDPSLYPPPPPQLCTCVLPGGVGFYSSGFDSNDVSTYPRCYPIVLTEGDGTKIFVSCIAFRDPVCEDISEAYSIASNSFADKCICLVSRCPCFRLLRDALEELYMLCFSPSGSSKPLWDVIAYMVSNVPIPSPGKDRVIFSIENCLLSVEVPPEEGLPHADISFQPLVQCLDVDNLIKLFTAVLLERRILLRSNKYTLLTLVSEAFCNLIYPFRWLHVYIPLLFFSGVDFIDAPTPYLIGLHSDVDTTVNIMDGVVEVDLEHNQITTTEAIPSLPEPELGCLREEIMHLLHSNVVEIDHLRNNVGGISDHFVRTTDKTWGHEHDIQFRFIFLNFLAKLLSGYRNFIDISSKDLPFNSEAFLKKRSLLTNQSEESMSTIAQILGSQIFENYIGRFLNLSDENNNLLTKLQDTTDKSQNPFATLPSLEVEPEIITISDPDFDFEGAKYSYDKFPSNRTEEQEEARKIILKAACWKLTIPGNCNSSSPFVDLKNDNPNDEQIALIELMALDIKVKLQGKWEDLLKLGPIDDPLSSPEYGTIHALIVSDTTHGIGGSGFVECIREYVNMGQQKGYLKEKQFIAVKELLKTAICSATSRNDMPTIRDALEVSSEMYMKDSYSVCDYVQRHLFGLPIWNELRFWDHYVDYLMEISAKKMSNHATLVTTQFVVVASQMAGLGLLDIDMWYMIETIAEKNKLEYEELIRLRGLLSHIQLLRVGYWGLTSASIESLSNGIPLPRVQGIADKTQQPINNSTVGRNWVHSMFRDSEPVKPDISCCKSELTFPGDKKIQTSVRILRGHTGAITALHCVSRREVCDLVGDRDDAGFFISGSTDCTVKIWDPSLRGSELRATLSGHKRPIRAIRSDRSKVVSGSDDHSVIVWDKQTSQLLKVLEGHNASVSGVRMTGECVVSASLDGTLKMWDTRTDGCVDTIGRCSSAVLCIDYDNYTGILAAAGRDAVAKIWDIRAGKQMHKFVGHKKWIRSIRLVGDTLLTGSDDWTARMWSVSRGSCDAILSFHAGPILCVEYSPADKGVITGSVDGIIRFWENQDGGMKCIKNETMHSAPIISISAGDHWLGIGAEDNSMSLFQRPQGRLGGFSNTGSKMGGWQLYRTPQRTLASVRCVASDLDRKRICSGGRNGLLHLWEATIKI